MTLSTIMLAASLSAAAPRAPVRIECEGPVEWRAGEGGASRLRLSGGVKLRRGGMTLRSSSAEASFKNGSAPPGLVRAEGGVTLESSGMFRVLADAAELREITPEAQEAGHPSPSYRITLLRGKRAEVVLRAGKVLIACTGPLVYETGSREAHLSLGVRAETPRTRMRCEDARVIFREATPEKEAAPGEDPREQEDAPPPLSGPERIYLRGRVVVDIEGDEKPARRVKAALATYDGAREVIVFSGEPAPEVRYQGVVLTAPDLTLYVRENRIESSTGKMRLIREPGQ